MRARRRRDDLRQTLTPCPTEPQPSAQSGAPKPHDGRPDEPFLTTLRKLRESATLANNLCMAAAAEASTDHCRAAIAIIEQQLVEALMEPPSASDGREKIGLERCAEASKVVSALIKCREMVETIHRVGRQMADESDGIAIAEDRRARLVREVEDLLGLPASETRPRIGALGKSLTNAVEKFV